MSHHPSHHPSHRGPWSRSKPPTTRFAGRPCRARGFTLVELLVVIAIISIIAGFLIPTLLRSRGEANKVACKNNLRELARMGMMYADTSGKRFFPYAGANHEAHEHMNVMVDFFGKELKPKLFICPNWRGDPATPDDEGKFVLEAESCAYTWAGQRISPTDGVAISSDKYVKTKNQLQGHEKGMNVVDTSGSVEFMFEEKLNEDGLPDGLVR